MLIEEVRFGLRMLRKNRAFTAIALLTLALGIGANTALFSVVNGVLFHPLPFSRPDQLVTLAESKPNFEHGSISYPNFLDWQKQNHTFSSIAIARTYAFSLTGTGEAEQVNSEFVSSEFFRLLGVNPMIGRNLVTDDERIGAAPVALVSEGFWHRKLGSDRDVLGKALQLDGKSYTVVGVIPEGFHLRIPSFRDSDVYVPIVHWNNSLLFNRGAGLGIHGIGRLKPGVTIEQAQADMDAVARGLAEAYPDADRGIGAKLVPMKQQMVGSVRPLLLVLLAAVGFVLLIACVNVANLLLARSTGRTREFAIRASLGASTGRVVQQLLVESVLLALAGGVLGLIVAAWGTQAALSVLPTTLPRAEEIRIDGSVLLFTLGASVFAGVLFGLAPAFKIARSDLQQSLREGGRGIVAGHHRTLGAFVVAELAVALVLLTGAGLMIRSLTRLWSIDPGFNPQRVLSFGISLPPSMVTAPPNAIRAAFREVDSKLASIPSVTAVSQTWGAVPMSGDDEQLFWLEGHPRPASENDMSWAIDYIVEPDYLKTMQIPLQRGRFFTAQDDEHAPRVMVVDDVFARKYFPDQNPIGQRIHVNNGDFAAEIIGVVGHVKQWGLDSDDSQSLRAQLYLPCAQMPDKFVAMTPSGSAVLLRSDGTDTALLDSIRHAVQQISNEHVVFGVQTMDGIIADSLARQRFSMILLGVFAGLALLLASIGIYGVISYVVGQRTHEIGVRLALGAQRQDILRMILASGGRLATIGILAGLAASFGLTRFMASLLYGTQTSDPLTFAAVTAVLALVALAACTLPARRAAKVDPMVALRYE